MGLNMVPCGTPEVTGTDYSLRAISKEISNPSTSLGVNSIPPPLVQKTLGAYSVKGFGEVQYSHVCLLALTP